MGRPKKKLIDYNLTGLTKIADKVFSNYIRKRDSEDGGGACRTCGKWGEIKYMDCGHFQSRRYKAIRWEEKNAALQCKNCNGRNNGEQYKMGKYLDTIWGEGTAEEMEGMRHKQAPNKLELIQIIEKYESI